MSKYFKAEPKVVKPIDEEMLVDILTREGWDGVPVTDDSLGRLEAKFNKAPKVKRAKPTTQVDNNGWGKEPRTPEQLARVTIDSDLSRHAMRIAPAKQEKPTKEDKRNSRKG